MGTILVVLGIVALALIGIVVYVFCSAARAFVSSPEPERLSDMARDRGYVVRCGLDRRQGGERRKPATHAVFPLVDRTGIVVEHDRRKIVRRSGMERRALI